MRKSQSPIGIVILNTITNYRNLNFTDLPLLRIAGRKIIALVYAEEYGRWIESEFHITDVYELHIHRTDVDYAKEILQKDMTLAK